MEISKQKKPDFLLSLQIVFMPSGGLFGDDLYVSAIIGW